MAPNSQKPNPIKQATTEYHKRKEKEYQYPKPPPEITCHTKNCQEPPTDGNRYCKGCTSTIRQQMKDSNYLETRGYGNPKGSNRTKDHKEIQRETRKGTEHG